MIKDGMDESAISATRRFVEIYEGNERFAECRLCCVIYFKSLELG